MARTQVKQVTGKQVNLPKELEGVMEELAGTTRSDVRVRKLMQDFEDSRAFCYRSTPVPAPGGTRKAGVSRIRKK